MAPPELDLVLDIGNTRTKAALFEQGAAVRYTFLPHGDENALLRFLGDTRPAGIVMASVAAPDPGFDAVLKAMGPVLEVHGDSAAPVKVGIDSPATLGADRLANAAALATCFAGRAALAIDAGTCITYDLVDAAGVFKGGAIGPGMAMRARAMHAYSARLPEVVPGDWVPLLGRHTASALAAGVFHGIRLEMAGMIEALGHEHPGLTVVLTGGDGLRFARALKSGIFADPLLTLRGLHAILAHHRGGGGPFDAERRA